MLLKKDIEKLEKDINALLLKPTKRGTVVASLGCYERCQKGKAKQYNRQGEFVGNVDLPMGLLAEPWATEYQRIKHLLE